MASLSAFPPPPSIWRQFEASAAVGVRDSPSTCLTHPAAKESAAHHDARTPLEKKSQRHASVRMTRAKNATFGSPSRVTNVTHRGGGRWRWGWQRGGQHAPLPSSSPTPSHLPSAVSITTCTHKCVSMRTASIFAALSMFERTRQI